MFDRVIGKLTRIEGSKLQRTAAIGELVLEQFFRGDPRVWRDRRRNKNLSIRRLAAREDCPLSRSALNDAIGIHVAVRELPCVLTFGHVSANHVVAVLKLPVSEREELLRQAEEHRWSVREFRTHVRSRAQARGQESTRRHVGHDAARNRPRGQESTTTERQALYALNGINDAISALADAVQELRKAGPLVSELRPNIEKLAGALSEIRSSLLEVPTIRA